MLVVVLVLENPDRFAIRLTEQISSIGLFAVTESQCTEDDEDDSKFRNLGLVGYSEILAIVGDIVRVKVPEEEVGISVTDCGPLCKKGLQRREIAGAETEPHNALRNLCPSGEALRRRR